MSVAGLAEKNLPVGAGIPMENFLVSASVQPACHLVEDVKPVALLNDRQLFQANERHVKTLTKVKVDFQDVSDHVLDKEELGFELDQLMQTAQEDQVILIQGSPKDRDNMAFGAAVVRDARRQQLTRNLSI